jgi:NADP-dependent 3-hydroxy acid dehydrogenase YdfG
MRRLSGKRYWLVGASEGLGRALALALSKAGAEVIVSARSEDKLKDLVGSLPGPASAVTVDVADRDSVARAAEHVGDIDGLVHLAAVYWPIEAQNWNAEQVEAMLDINVTGAARVVGAVLPRMIERDQGHIVLCGSLSGFRGLKGSNGYSPSKAGVMAMAETLHADLRETGVDIQLANPGFIRTRLTDKNDFDMAMLMEPEEAADQMIALMRSDKFSKSFPRILGWYFRFSQFLPDWLYYRYFPGAR